MATPSPNTVCLTLNPSGGFVGTITLGGVTYIVSLAPQFNVPGGYVLTILDATSGLTLIYVASAISTCDLLVFTNILLQGTAYTLTVANNSLCCSSSSASSVSATLVQTQCCPNGIPTTVYATLGSADGTCTNIALNNASVPLVWNGSGWVGTVNANGGPPLGYQWTITLTCEFTSGHWAWLLAVTCAQKVEAISVQCSPFLLKFRINMSGQDSPCCTGHLTVVVSQ